MQDDNELKNEDQQLMQIYEWVDSLNLSKPKKNISRDFSDGYLLAEIFKKIYPNLVDLHNYPESQNTTLKTQNWNTLKMKVLSKIGINISNKEIEEIVKCKAFAIEKLLAKIYNKIFEDSKIVDIDEEIKKREAFNNKNVSKEEMIKNAIKEKDNKIAILNSTLEVLQLKLYNSEEENNKLKEKIQEYQMKLMNKK